MKSIAALLALVTFAASCPRPPGPPTPSPSPSAAPSPSPSAAPSPSPSPSVVPTPLPSPSPPPSGNVLCNGSWHASDCSVFVVSRMGCGVLTVQRDHQTSDRDGSEAKPAWTGDKVILNSSPKYRSDLCVRGAVVPGNCVVERFANVTRWSISPDIEITVDHGDNSLGYLANFKPQSAGQYVATVCIGAVCQSSAPIYVVDAQ